MGFLRDVRLIPVVLVATACLFALKVSGLILNGGYTLGERMAANADQGSLKITTAASVPPVTPIVHAGEEPKAAPQPWAKEMFNFGDVTGSVGGDKKKDESKDAKDGKDTKSGEAAKDNNKDDKKEAAKVPAPPQKMPGVEVPLQPALPAGERAILSSLQGRREQLDQRSRELDMRESLLKAAEKRLEARVAELRGMEARIKGAETKRSEDNANRFKGIVAMYEAMKPKDAARIFDGLDQRILVEVATHMKPQAMSAILAQMKSENAERLTVELAGRNDAHVANSTDSLPQIQGKPTP
ncbi:MAG: Flagellar motility protein MotE, a chaperone for MotC folding [Pseudolabrys sp.]|jgi:flagellar motility protein MotE (MotC chaperone)|nr:Flagellar motility protein MotE, a chaperone for MotC folding [Pseudolabrys sp.]